MSRFVTVQKQILGTQEVKAINRTVEGKKTIAAQKEETEKKQKMDKALIGWKTVPPPSSQLRTHARTHARTQLLSAVGDECDMQDLYDVCDGLPLARLRKVLKVVQQVKDAHESAYAVPCTPHP